MRAFKGTFALAGLLALVQYATIYYTSLQFNEFVQRQAKQSRPGQLRSAVLNKARDFSLPVTETDINITTRDGVLRVAVDYTVPLNLLLYHPGVKFRASGAAFWRE